MNAREQHLSPQAPVPPNCGRPVAPVVSASGSSCFAVGTIEVAHRPVLLAEAIAALAVHPSGVYVDATFGGGGYSRGLLAAGAGTVIGVDRDPQAVARGRELARAAPGFIMLAGRFGDLDSLLAAHGVEEIDGIVFDLGVSSPQLDDPARGFSFRVDGPLDMRMGGDGPSAADVVNTASANELERILRTLGEEPAARRIARAIVRHREAAPITRTWALSALIAATVGQRGGRTDPATRSFQALRIYVNDELGELERALAASQHLLRPGGRLAIVSFHSLEDRIVKRFFTTGAGVSRHLPPPPSAPSRWRLIGRGVMRPSTAEVAANPRARSAKLRVAERLAEVAA